MDEKILVVYRSKYGATKRYAELLGQRLGCPVLENRGLGNGAFAGVGTVILCGGVYASQVLGSKLLHQAEKALKGKRLAVLAVGASPYDAKALAALKARTLKGAFADVPLFYARGAWREGEMGLVDRTLCKLLQKEVAKKDPATLEPWEAALINAMGADHDWVDAKELAPLLHFLGAEGEKAAY